MSSIRIHKLFRSSLESIALSHILSHPLTSSLLLPSATVRMCESRTKKEPAAGTRTMYEARTRTSSPTTKTSTTIEENWPEHAQRSAAPVV